MPNILEKYYNNIDKKYGINSLRKKKILSLAALEDSSKSRIMDIGCAEGYLSAALKKPSNYVVGLDISEKNINEAKKVLDQAIVFDIESEDWPNDFIENKFDLIVCAEVIEHLFDQDGAIAKISKILKPDGRLIISSPNFLVWNNRLRILFGHYGAKEIFFDQGHIHLLSYNGLKDKFEKNGFQIVAEDNLWYPNNLEFFKLILPKNLFIYQSIICLKNK